MGMAPATCDVKATWLSRMVHSAEDMNCVLGLSVGSHANPVRQRENAITCYSEDNRHQKSK